MQGVHSVQITLLSHASLSTWGWGGNGRGLFTGGDGRIPWALTQYFSRVLSKQLENGSLSHLANPSTPGDPRNGQLTERVHACSFSLGETVPRLPSATNQEHVTLSGLDPENWHLLPYPGSLSPLAPRIKSKEFGPAFCFVGVYGPGELITGQRLHAKSLSHKAWLLLGTSLQSLSYPLRRALMLMHLGRTVPGLGSPSHRTSEVEGIQQWLGADK